MMTHKEIRIGNLVLGRNGEIRRVISIHLDKASYTVHYAENTRQGDYIGDINPIPLTPEILIASGFSQSFTSDPQEPDYSQVFEINHVSIHQHSKKENKFFWYNGDLEVEIKPLHQLQNLYWCLVGKELQYNPQQ